MEQSAPTPAVDPAPALTRGLAVLRCLGADGPQTLEQLAAWSGWPKSSLLRVLQSLTGFGAVRRDASTKRYHAVLTLAPIGSGRPGLIERAAPMLEALCERGGQTCELYAWTGDGLTMIDRREPEEAMVSVRARIGFTRSLAEVEALSQVVHAFDPEAALPKRCWVWHDGLPTRLTRADARRLIDDARDAGVGTDAGINDYGVRRYAAPILGGRALEAVIAIAEFCGPTQRNPDPMLRDAVRDAAATLNEPGP